VSMTKVARLEEGTGEERRKLGRRGEREIDS
jgi:hypothetical protein